MPKKRLKSIPYWLWLDFKNTIHMLSRGNMTVMSCLSLEMPWKKKKKEKHFTNAG